MKKTLGAKLREERERTELSLEQVAEKIGSAKSYVWELENKESSRPSADKIFKLAELYAVTPDYLMDETGRVPREPDRAFFSKFQKLSDKNKEKLMKFMEILDE